MARMTVESCLRARAPNVIHSERLRTALRASAGRVEAGHCWCPGANGGQRLIEFQVWWGHAVLIVAPREHGGQRVLETVWVELGPGPQVHFGCPKCQRRVQDLYLRNSRFLCRRCHGLAYASQQQSRPRWLRRQRREAKEAERERFRQWRAEAEVRANDETEASREWEEQEAEVQRLLAREEEARREAERQYRRRYVQHTGRPGRPKEKRRYRHDGSRRGKLKPGEAYCCRCRAARPYRYPRRAELGCAFDHVAGAVIDTRTAIRARCRVCNTPVFRIVRPEEAEGLQDFWG